MEPETLKSLKKDKKHKKSSKEHRSHSKKKSKRTKSESSSEDEQHHKQSNKKYEKSSSHQDKDKPANKKRRYTEDENEDKQAVTNDKTEKLELSIEETNKLRAQLGLKPLQVEDKTSNESNKSTNISAEGNRIYHDKKTDETFEHIPAKNFTDTKQESTLREKLSEQREKRKLQDKFTAIKGLADSDNEDDSAVNWVQKIKETQKLEALKKEKLLEEMDEQFVNSESTLVDDSTKKTKKPMKLKGNKNYTESDLSGLKVEHSQEYFKEGQEIVLTLKDKNVLDEDADDVLINVNIADDEKAAKNIENKKKKPAYKPYDEFDEFGVYKEKKMLEKYDEELEGEQKKSFVLGSGGFYDARIDKFIAEQNEEYKSKAVKLDLNEFKIASDYFTKDEIESFKKPKKLRKKLRKPMKADDLLPIDENEDANESIESNKSKIIEKLNNGSRKTTKLENETKIDANIEPITKKISLKDIDFDFKNTNNADDYENNDYNDGDSDNNEDFNLNENTNGSIDSNEKYLNINDEAYDELHNVLSKIRKRVVNNKISEIAEHLIAERESEEIENSNKTEETKNERIIDMDEYNENEGTKSIVLDTMSEFCRNLGEIKTSSSAANSNMNQTQISALKRGTIDENEIKEDEDDEFNLDESFSGDDTNDNEMNISKKRKTNEDLESRPILDDEPVIDRGLANALKLAYNKGYIENEKQKQNARINVTEKDKNEKSTISALNYTVEEKNFYDIDDKYTRNRERFGGPISEFKEKEGYKPNVKLEYVNELGHRMNEKEAFRYLSHRFHGKGSGKKKTEKRTKKFKEMELMHKMSSVDTPLNTVSLLIEKQKKLQQPYVVLSTSKQDKHDQITLNKP